VDLLDESKVNFWTFFRVTFKVGDHFGPKPNHFYNPDLCENTLPDGMFSQLQIALMRPKPDFFFFLNASKHARPTELKRMKSKLRKPE